MILRVWLRLQWHKIECPLPILLPTTLAVWLLSFIVTFREFAPPTILEGADSMMLGPLLWRYVASTDIQRRVLELRSHPGRRPSGRH
jgi:ABC-type Fe3+ transport system permease subunit